jgi:carbamoyltransferase
LHRSTHARNRDDGEDAISTIRGTCGPAWPRLGRLAYSLGKPLARLAFGLHGLYAHDGTRVRENCSVLTHRLERGETVYLVGLGVSGHNSGVALVEVSARKGVRLLANDEEERFTGIKHFDGYPEQSVDLLWRRLAQCGLLPADVHAWLTSWDYISLVPRCAGLVLDHFPASLSLLRPSAAPNTNIGHLLGALAAPKKLGRQLGLGRVPLFGMPHHENHAAFSWAVSPFNRSEKPVLITVLDGFGDDGAISLFVAEGGRLRCLGKNQSLFDSLGLFYCMLSSTQGGWTPLSSEGRYMGAAAWGDGDRLTNPWYRRLREIFHLGEGGQVFVNRSLTNMVRAGERKPYTSALEAILGKPIPRERMWNPDAILRVEDIRHSAITRERVDLAAATQMVFEDALFHIVDHLIRTTRADQLVLTGGTALNCLANMRLLERFDHTWYAHNLGMDTCLHVWVPPIPSDAGAAVGAAYHFALQAGARPGEVLEHAFYCGLAPTTGEIRAALTATPEVGFLSLGNVRDAGRLREVADFAAFVVERDGVLGLFQGPAETGPRALGHRSILANPCNPRTLENINARVKFREAVRPLAPMATLAAARRFFEMPAGGSDADANAFNYMVLTTRARPEAYEKIPAVVHQDGTARVQIVRRQHDPLTYAYLEALGRRLGVEVSVNTSLNVGTPIVQTPAQALVALKRAKAMTGLLMVGAEGDAFLAWHAVQEGPKDAGRQLLAWYEEWRWQAGHRLEAQYQT